MQFTRENLQQEMIKRNYIASDEVLDAAFNSIQLRKPLLIDGPAGVGKTELAKVLADITGSVLIRMQCYHGLEPSDLLYDIDREKIQSYQNMLSTHIQKIVEGCTWEEAVRRMEQKQFFSSTDFVIKRPVFQALDPTDKRYKLLLIDEIDKASEKIEALLLEALSDYQISIPEVGTIEADHTNHPLVVITANRNRELGEPLRRRCTYLFIDYPSIETEITIIEKKCNVPHQYAVDAATLMRDLRHNCKMKKLPSVSEVIDWVNAMYYLYGIASISIPYWELIKKTSSTIAKSRSDQEAFFEYMDNLAEKQRQYQSHQE